MMGLAVYKVGPHQLSPWNERNSMNGKSLSEQLNDHLIANDEYTLMKQVDKEATAAVYEDELVWLRELEKLLKQDDPPVGRHVALQMVSQHVAKLQGEI
jgi:hypothetical protein